LWDIYDDHNDADSETLAEGDTAYWHLFANMQNFPAGVANRDIDEPWSNTNYDTIDNYDGRGMNDYVYWYGINYVDPFPIAIDNCNPI
jgi:hypothetical protein